MTIANMMKYIDVLTPAIQDCPYFTVDITEKYVSVISSRGPMGVWGDTGLLSRFQNRDNIRILSIGLFIPENFALTSVNPEMYNNMGGTPVPEPIGTQYTAMFDSSDVNGTWLANHQYVAGAEGWLDMGLTSRSPQVKLTLANSETDSSPNVNLPGYGCSDIGVFVLPFPNYELVLDLYCDIANFSRTLIPNDDFFVWGGFFLPPVSMVGVPSDLDGRIIKMTPFVKIAHTCPILAPVAPPVPPLVPPVAEFSWRDHNWEENEDPHGDAYHNDPIDYPVPPT